MIMMISSFNLRYMYAQQRSGNTGITASSFVIMAAAPASEFGVIMDPDGSCRTVTQGETIAPFIAKLFTWLEAKNSEEYITWANGGRSICVRNQEAFAKLVLPVAFKHSNMPSFVRQLNLHGFNKLPGPECEFANPNFQAGRPWQLPLIKRKKVASGSASGSAVDATKSRDQPPGKKAPGKSASLHEEVVFADKIDQETKAMTAEFLASKGRLLQLQQRLRNTTETCESVCAESESLWKVISGGASEIALRYRTPEAPPKRPRRE